MNLRRSHPLDTSRAPSASRTLEPGVRDERSRSGSLLGTGACLVTTLHPERGLALALVQHLADELPDHEFTLEERSGLASIWVCGYDPGQAHRIGALRARHPHALLIVTSKAAEDAWTDEVLAAGADHALSLPLDLGRMARLLRRRTAASA